MYANGEVPTSLLVQRPSAGKDPCLMMPGTAAKHDRLVQLGAPYGWVPLVSGPADAYRRLAVQQYYWDTMPRGQAAYPRTSSHGGTFDFEDGNGEVEQGAVDYGNWAEIGWDLFQQLTRQAGFLPGVFIGRPGIPDEYWHVFDPTPWSALSATTASPEEDDMPVFIEPNHVITWANGYTNSYDPNVFEVLRWVAKGQTNEQWCVDIWVSEAWKAAEYMATFEASKVSIPAVLSPDEIAAKVAAALAPKA